MHLIGKAPQDRPRSLHFILGKGCFHGGECHYRISFQNKPGATLKRDPSGCRISQNKTQPQPGLDVAEKSVSGLALSRVTSFLPQILPLQWILLCTPCWSTLKQPGSESQLWYSPDVCLWSSVLCPKVSIYKRGQQQNSPCIIVVRIKTSTYT